MGETDGPSQPLGPASNGLDSAKVRLIFLAYSAYFAYFINSALSASVILAVCPLFRGNNPG